MPAWAGAVGGGHHAAPGATGHASCVHAVEAHAVEAVPHEGSESAPDTGPLAAADCALTHLGQAVLDPPAAVSLRVTPYTYPPGASGDLAGRVPGLEGDPPKRARIV